MDWSFLIVLAIAGGFFLWRQSKNAEAAKVANARLERGTRLYQRIKEGMREYHWREREQPLWRAKHGELVFETAHMSAFHVSHVGFYFKDLDEYGLYGFFAGNGDEFFESYYRTDRTFQEEGQLLHKMSDL
ncbi:hypothetical protein ACH79_20475 [Bradyrhizobium sp. CCBAU 051011]|uniref:hypothetical protein n=1 Tax=Bradyrhizobium sp. CCBAU 051011 TaxID=858422 RepID=UPI0013745C4A|nr:hypothetical protein [Bradyrhizobium sp. CCBAU 051011]QHO74658.1 hypothetical protein ACH79_20475 [Bradyrhizobium sp. CCBAU 051011]